jgi:hypothetical protein
MVLAVLAGLVGGLLTFLAAKGAARWRNKARHD